MLVKILVESLLAGLEVGIAGQDRRSTLLIVDCLRARGSYCADGLPLLLDLQLAQVGLGELDELVALPGQDGPGRVQGEALDLRRR